LNGWIFAQAVEKFYQPMTTNENQTLKPWSLECSLNYHFTYDTIRCDNL